MVSIKYLLKNLFSVLNFLERDSKRKIIFLTFLTTLNAFSEIFSIALLIPFITVITNIDKIYSIDFINNLILLFNLNDQNSVILFFIFSFALFIIITGILKLVSLRSILDISRLLGEELIALAYKKIVYLPYEEYIYRSSSEQIVALNQFAQELTNSIYALVNLFSCLTISSIILITLILINWKLVLAVSSTFIFSYLIIALGVKNKTTHMSKRFASSSKRQVEIMQESFGSAKNIAIDNLYDYFLDNFKKENHIYRNSVMKMEFYARAPRYILETFSLVIFSLLAVFLLSETNNASELVTILGVVALSSQRLLPYMQQIYGAWILISGSYKGVEVIKNILNEKDSQNLENFDNFKDKNFFKKEIKLVNTSFYYKDSKKSILKNINLDIKKGSKVGIIGETGAGKSTLLDIFMSLIEPSKGKLLIDGKDIHSNKLLLKKWRAIISYVPQDIFLINKTIKENIAFGLPLCAIDNRKLKKAIKTASLVSLIESKPKGINTLIGERGIQLSGGQRQRIAIARALYKESEILFFDEATSALDRRTEDKIINSIYKEFKDITIFFISHNLNALRKCDYLIRVINGKLFIINPEELEKINSVS